jgi:hypothetical protein
MYYDQYFDKSEISPNRIMEAIKSQDFSKLSNVEKTYIDKYDLKTLELLFDSKTISFKHADTDLPTEQEYMGFSANYYSFQLKKCSDAHKGIVEPVFFTFSFYKDLNLNKLMPTYATVKKVKPKLVEIIEDMPYKVESNEEVIFDSDERDEIYFPKGTRRLYKGSVPILVVDAIEDDTYFSDSTKRTINLLFEIASIFAVGELATAIAISRYVYKLLCYIDALDSDDIFYPDTFELDPQKIPISDNKTFHLKEQKGDNLWDLTIHYDATDKDPQTFDPDSLLVKQSKYEWGLSLVDAWQIGYTEKMLKEALNPTTGERTEVWVRQFISIIDYFKTKESAEELVQHLQKHKITRVHAIPEDFQQRYIWIEVEGRSPRIYLDKIQYSREFGVNDLEISGFELPINTKAMEFSVLHKKSLKTLEMDGSGLSPINTWKVMEKHKKDKPLYYQSIFDWWGEPKYVKDHEANSKSHEVKCVYAIDFARIYKWLMVQRLDTYNKKFLVV